MQWHALNAPPSLDPITDFRLSRPRDMLPGLGGDIWWSALVDLRDSSLDALESAVNASLGSAGRALVVPDVFDSADRSAVRDAQIVPVFARDSALSAMNAADNPFSVAGLHLGIALAEGAISPDAAPRDSGPEITVPEGTVLMLVIDDGIAIGHQMFGRDPLRSRIELAYVMGDGPATGGLPRRDHGHCLDRRTIDALLAAHTCGGLLDEAGFYRAAGIVDPGRPGFSPTALRRSHGTHVMSLAAGFAPHEAPDTRPILCAMLPPHVSEDVTGQDLAPSLALALEVLLQQAARYRLPDATVAPVVLNFSYGNFAGPHDGTGLIARMIDAALARHPAQARRAVLPAGNGNLSRTHAEVGFGKGRGKTVTLDLMALPDDRSASHVQMWMPYGEPDALPDFVTVRVTPPGGPQSPPVAARPGEAAVLLDGDGREIARLSYRFAPWPTCRGEITLSLHPTASLDRGAALAPSGQWAIKLSRGAIASGQVVQVRVRRDETLPGYPLRGRQAYFANACYQRFDAFGAPLAVDPPDTTCPVRRAGTISGFATGSAPLVVAGLTQSNGLLSDYSAAGPLTPPRDHRAALREGPDAAARSDHSPVLRGVIGAGSHSGSVVRMNGTSVAAPLVARLIADALEAGQTADRDWLHRRAARDDNTYPAPKPAETRSGGGRLRAASPFDTRGG